MARQGAEHANLIGGSKRRPQEADGVQVPQPLAIGNIGSSASNVLEIPRVDQADFEPAGFQDLEQRNPVDAGGLHRHRFDSAGLEPVRQPMEIFRECGEGSHRFGVSVRRHGNEDFRCAYVHSRRIGPQHRQFACALGRFHLPLLARDMIRSPRLDVTEGGGPGRAKRYSPKRDHQHLGNARRWRHHCCEHGTRNHACITGFNGSTDAAVSTVAVPRSTRDDTSGSARVLSCCDPLRSVPELA